MYENEIIEMEDFSFNHYLHHFEECEGECLIFTDEFNTIEVIEECIEESI